MPTVEFHYDGGDVRRISVDPYETVYQAAARSNAPILTDCLEGVCATCKAECIEGEFSLIDPSFDALSAEDEAARQVLLCQMEPTTDCVVRMPYSLAFAADAEPQSVDATVRTLDVVGADIVRLALTPAASVSFVPGQYAQLTVPGTSLSRAYSFANDRAAAELAFYVRLLPGGVMSDYLRDRAAVGDVLTLSAPLGAFYVRPGTGPVVLVAGGTGVAPILSMLSQLRQDAETANRARRVTVLHGARRAEELVAQHQSSNFQSDVMQLDVRSAVDEGPATDALVGPVTALMSAELFEEEGTSVYLCGPPPMVQAAEARLAELGMPGARVHAERFNPA